MDNSSAQSAPDLDAVIAEFLEAEEAGRPIPPVDWIARHPEFADELREFFADRDVLRSAARPLADAVVMRRPVLERLRYFGDYELLEEVARGGMGVVYRARQESLNRIVAVKMILAGNLASEVDVQRFQTEAEAAARLQHPNIVSVHEVGRHAGQSYFSMDYVEGRNLSEIIHEDPLPIRQAAKYVAEIAEAVHYAHQQGTLHRDLKPSNVMIDAAGRVRITDFGLALNVESDSKLTRSGQALGTPAYMPPEQAEGNRGLVGPASDVYSLGAILYELITGRPPFRGESPLETLRQVIESEPLSPRLLNPSVPPDLETICLKCLQKESHQRFPTAKHLADDLRRFVNGEPIQARPIGRIARLWRWCRRRPLPAGLSAALLLAIVATLVTLTVANLMVNSALRDRTAALARAQIEKRAAETASKQRDHANAKLKSTLERTRWDAYRLAISLAVREGEAGNLQRAREILAACGPEELRGFEWHYLSSRFRKPLLAEWGGRMRRPVHPLSRTGRAIAEVNGELHVYDARANRVVRKLPVPRFEYAHGISPDARWVAFVPTRSVRRTIRVRSLVGEQPPPTITLPRDSFVQDVLFSRDGRRVLALVEQFTARPNSALARRITDRTSVAMIWDVSTGRLLSTHRNTALPRKRKSSQRDLLAVDGEFRLLLTPMALIDLRTAKTVLTFDEPAETVALSRDASLAAVATKQGKVAVWNTHSKRIVDAWSSMRRIWRLTFRPDGREIAAGCTDGTVEFRDLAGRRQATPLPAGTAVRDLEYLPNGKRLLTVHALRRGTMNYRQWGLDRDATLVVPCPTSGESTWGRQVAFSPDSRFVAAVGENGTIRLLDARSGRAIREFQIRVRARDQLASLAFSPDGGTIAAAGRDGFFVWDVQTGRLRRTLKPDVGTFCTQAAFSPNGRLLAGAHEDGFTVWTWTSGRLARAMPSRGSVFGSIGFSSDGRFLFTTANRGRGRIWNVADWSVRCWLPDAGYRGGVLSPDDKRLALPAAGELRFFDTTSGKPLSPLQFSGLRGEVSFSRDGKRIAASSGNRVRLFDAKTGQLVLTLSGHKRRVTAVAFSPDGRRLATAAEGGTLRIWGEPAPAD